MARVVHFEIHAADPDRAVSFYRELFSWEFTRWEGPWDYWLIRTGGSDQPGIDGGLVKRRGPAPTEGQAVNAFVCTVEVPHLEPVLAKAASLGGGTAVARMPVAGIGWLAYILDPDGNILGIMQPDPTAK